MFATSRKADLVETKKQDKWLVRRIWAYLGNYSERGFVDFGVEPEGCKDTCRGWNGRSRTCDCGANKPVWEVYRGEVFPTFP